MHGVDPVGERVEVARARRHGHVAPVVLAGEGDYGHLHVVLLAVAELGGVAEPEGQGARLDRVQPVPRDDAEVVPYPRQDLTEVTSHVARVVGLRVEVSPAREEDAIRIGGVVPRKASRAHGAERRGSVHATRLVGVRVRAQGVREVELHGG